MGPLGNLERVSTRNAGPVSYQPPARVPAEAGEVPKGEANGRPPGKGRRTGMVPRAPGWSIDSENEARRSVQDR